ncbi:hypothetical protein ACFVYG_32650 [Streptomyces sp. NPDC058256]|uniref:hypothetical protein n=1 Tax=Streptomyces sp. NPDC058256 TaxID=3346408 RepID=UPI0036E4FC96
MLNSDELAQGGVTECVDAVVGSGGGLLLYDQGLAGRETLLAAGAQLAIASGRPLIVVDASSLRNDTAAFLGQLGMPHHVFLSPAEASQWPTGFTPDGVLAIHTDVLLDPAVEEPLLAAVREASRTGHLLVARRPDGLRLLDAYTVRTHQLISASVTTAPAGVDDNAEPARLRTPDRVPGPIAEAVARQRARQDPEVHWIGVERDPVTATGGELYTYIRMSEPNSYSEQTLTWEEWAQSFTDAPTTRPYRIAEETRQRFQRFQRLLGNLQAPRTAEGTPSRRNSPDDTGTSHEPRADAAETPAHSPSDTGSAQSDALSIEELNTVLEDPDLLQRVQQQAESMQARVLARREQAAAAAELRRADAQTAAAQRPTPGSSEERHGTAQRQAYGQDQNTSRQHPGR